MTASSRERAAGLGRGVSTLIPSSPTEATALDRAAAALAPLRPVPVPAGVLEAAALLLTELADSGDDAVRLTAATTRDHLLAALATASPTANAVKTP